MESLKHFKKGQKHESFPVTRVGISIDTKLGWIVTSVNTLMQHHKVDHVAHTNIFTPHNCDAKEKYKSGYFLLM